MTTISYSVAVFLVLCASVRLRCFVSFSAFSALSFLSFYVSGLFRSILAPLLAVDWGNHSTLTNEMSKAAMMIGYKLISEEPSIRLRSCCSI